MNTTDITKHVSLSDTRDPSPLEMDAETFYHLGMLADFLATVMNPSAAGGDHAAIYVEHCVVRWLMELIGFSIEGSAGILVGGGSVASLYCLAVARQWAAAQGGWNMRTEGLQSNHLPLVL